MSGGMDKLWGLTNFCMTANGRILLPSSTSMAASSSRLRTEAVKESAAAIDCHHAKQSTISFSDRGRVPR